MTKTHPILFSTTMVQAILNGNKSMTRRIIKPQPIDNTEVDGNFFEGKYKGYVKVDGHPHWKEQFIHEFCKYKEGDILWVRESWQKLYETDENEILNLETEYYRYAADNPEPINLVDGDGFLVFNTDGSEKMIPWKPSIHMPYMACRLFLRIKSINIERLQEITRGDAMQEGCPYPNMSNGQDPRDWFTKLWSEINGENSWKANPWVWVIEFERIEKP